MIEKTMLTASTPAESPDAKADTRALDRSALPSTIETAQAARICIVHDTEISLSETFIRAHVECLPGVIQTITGWWPHDQDGEIFQPRLLRRGLARALSSSRRTACAPSPDATLAYMRALRKHRPDVVLAEYGPTGTQVAEACERLKIPLVVHFHGYDAGEKAIIDANRGYRKLFDVAKAVIVVSNAMGKRLIELGAPPEKIKYNVYGVRTDRFERGKPDEAGPILLAVGRLCEKKAPHLSLLAFSRILRNHPDAKIRFLGAGPLLPICQDLVRELNLESSVTLLGSQPHNVIPAEMRNCRAFVQHSVVASNGDREGTPVSILEACASGLPVVATQHEGISDIITHGQTGFLVPERDVAGMALWMDKLISEPQLAKEMGRKAADHVREHHSMENSIAGLSHIIQSCVK